MWSYGALNDLVASEVRYFERTDAGSLVERVGAQNPFRNFVPDGETWLLLEVLVALSCLGFYTFKAKRRSSNVFGFLIWPLNRKCELLIP